MDSEHMANFLEKILLKNCLEESTEDFKITDVCREESMLIIDTEKDSVKDEYYIFVVRNRKYKNSED